MLKEILMSILTAVGITVALIIARRVTEILNTFLEKKKAEAEEAQNKSAATAYAMANHCSHQHYGEHGEPDRDDTGSSSQESSQEW